MSGIKALRKIQLGREVTPGTIVAATTIWRGLGTIEDQREPVIPDEDVGFLSGVDRSYIAQIGGGLSLESVEATFEQIPHIFEMGIKTVTPTADGSGSGKIYTYDFPTTAANTIKTYTVEGGDNQQAEVMEYTHASEFTLEGDGGGAWMISGELVGRQVANQNFTASVALPTVEDILFLKSKLYIDAIGGTWGTTLKSNTLLAASLNYKTGLLPKFTAEGNLYFAFVQTTPPEVTLSITFEHDATATAEKDNWRNQTARLIRLISTGSAFQTAGTTYSNKTMAIDLAGKWTSFKAIGDRDGNDIIEAEFVSRYDPTAAKFGRIIVVNALASLP